MWRLAYCMIILLSGSSAYAQQPIIEINIVAPEIKPLIFLDKNGKVSGHIIDSLQQVTDNTHLKLNVNIVPWARALKQVINDDVDAVMPTLYTKERAEHLYYPSQALIKFYGSVIIKRVEDDFQFTDFSSIGTQKTIAKVRAMLLGAEFDDVHKNGHLKVVEVTQLEDALNMLMYKRVDLVVADGYVAKTILEQMGIVEKISIIAISEQEENSYIAFSKKFSERHDINKIMSLVNQYNKPEKYHGLLQDN